MLILAFAYACEPGKGSEPEAGWNWARLLARLGETWVITRANNRSAIEAALPHLPERDALHFVYVDLPEWARRWKRGQRGVRLYYMLWQAAALRRARQLHARQHFDLVWHLTLANAWLGSLAPLVGPPFVMGPVGGGAPLAPIGLAPVLGIRGVIEETLRVAAQFLGRWVNPFARLAWSRAELILAQNRDTRRWFPPGARPKVIVFPNALVDTVSSQGRRRDRHDPPVALFAGRLTAYKGAGLAIRAISLTSQWHLIIAGAGPEGADLHRLAERLQVSDRVHFLGWQPRVEVFRLMHEDADVFLFPTIREAAGLALLEAMASGLPVVCLDIAGPAALVGHIGALVPASGGSRTISTALALELSAPQNGDAALARARLFTLDAASRRLRSALASVHSLQGLAIGAHVNGLDQETRAGTPEN